MAFMTLFALTSQLWAGRVDSNGLRRAWVNKRFKTEDEALEFIIQHSIPVLSLQAPSDIERFKHFLREWNPHIKDWAKMGAWEEIYVKRKNPIYDLSFGYHFYRNTETLSRGGAIFTENRGPTFDLKINFIHTLEWRSYFNYKLMKKNNIQLVYLDRIYTFPINHSFEYGVAYEPQFSAFSYGMAVGWQQFSFLSFNSDKYKIQRYIEQNLQVSSSQVVWFIPEVNYHYSTFGHGSYITLAMGYSPIGTKSLDDGSKKESITSSKWRISYKQYIKSNLWFKSYYENNTMKGNTVTVQGQYGLFVGLSL